MFREINNIQIVLQAIKMAGKDGVTLNELVRDHAGWLSRDGDYVTAVYYITEIAKDCERHNLIRIELVGEDGDELWFCIRPFYMDEIKKVIKTGKFSN